MKSNFPNRIKISLFWHAIIKSNPVNLSWNFSLKRHWWNSFFKDTHSWKNSLCTAAVLFAEYFLSYHKLEKRNIQICILLCIKCISIPCLYNMFIILEIMYVSKYFLFEIEENSTLIHVLILLMNSYRDTLNTFTDLLNPWTITKLKMCYFIS